MVYQLWDCALDVPALHFDDNGNYVQHSVPSTHSTVNDSQSTVIAELHIESVDFVL